MTLNRRLGVSGRLWRDASRSRTGGIIRWPAVEIGDLSIPVRHLVVAFSMQKAQGIRWRECSDLDLFTRERKECAPGPAADFEGVCSPPLDPPRPVRCRIP
jgi:hypothetical protein